MTTHHSKSLTQNTRDVILNTVTRFKREILIGFALLDVVLFSRFLKNIPYGLSFPASANTWWYNQFYFTQALFLISLLPSALGLACQQKWSFFISYIQFPFRYAFLLFSFGFLTKLLPMKGTYFIHPLLIVAACLEVGRVLITIMIHIKTKQTPDIDVTGVTEH